MVSLVFRSHPCLTYEETLISAETTEAFRMKFDNNYLRFVLKNLINTKLL